jgi:hypothetical protein
MTEKMEVADAGLQSGNFGLIFVADKIREPGEDQYSGWIEW